MLRETKRTKVLASKSDIRVLPTRTGMETVTVRVQTLAASVVETSGIGVANGHAVQDCASGNKSFSGESPDSAGKSLSFRQWAQISCGIRQRMEAVSACLNEIFRRSTIPEFLDQNSSIVRQLRTVTEQIGDIRRNSICWGWLASTDLHVADNGTVTVIDHNLSVPTGIELLTRLVNRSSTESLTALNDLWRNIVNSAARYGGTVDAQSTVILDPCRYNPTFSENEFLARVMGAQIVHVNDLAITKDGVELSSVAKPKRIQTVVRRIDDDLLDPNCFRPDSLVGVPGLCRAWKDGRVNLVNPPGSGVASIRSFTQKIPAMIRTFLGEEPALSVAECRECSGVETMQNLINNPTQFAVRTNDPIHPARPFFGDTATAAETVAILKAVRRDPQNFVVRDLLPEAARGGFNLRVFSSMGDVFCMPRCGIGRNCQADGGATLAINADNSVFFVN